MLPGFTSRLMLILFLLWAQRAALAQPGAGQVQWLRTHLVPIRSAEPTDDLSDLAPLKSLIGDARIVSLGEGTHGTREFFQMKHRLVQFLVREMGFTLFSIEASMPEAYRLNDYVLHGKGDPRELIHGMYFWTWNTEEVLAMVEWMRAFNQSGKGRIEFTGFDMQTPDVAMKIVEEFLQQADPQYAEQVGKLYSAARAGDRNAREFGVATGSFPVEAARGRKLRYSGWIKTEKLMGQGGFAGLWWRCDGPSGVLAFDNMQANAVAGTTDWTRYHFDLDIPKETTNINFGVLQSGTGTAWFDDIRITLDGEPAAEAAQFDLDFEGRAANPLYMGGRGYQVAIEGPTAKSGSRSLAIRARSDAESPSDFGKAADSASAVRTELERRREEWRAGREPRDLDWVIQNSRVVEQCYQMHANLVSRDVSMARNVKWILDHAPAGTKIVLWAHNGHVNRAAYMDNGLMGWHLDQWYGKQQVVIGFTATGGEYTAMSSGGGLRSDHKLQEPIAGSFEEFFHAAGVPSYLVDLRQADAGDAACSWLTETRPMRSIGALEMSHQFAPAPAQKLYDLLIHFETTSATRLLRK